MIFRIPSELRFPDPSLADPSGLLGVGGDLSPERLLLGYRQGIFPWFSSGQPILWWSPDPRMVLFPGELHVPRSLAKRIRQKPYQITLDRAFAEVVTRCAQIPRPGQRGTWITPEMLQAYQHLHALGHAHSVEAWRGDELVGGLYGVAIGGLFSGESMFTIAPDASKIAFIHLAHQLIRWDFSLIDCQIYTDHLARFGAREISRESYLQQVQHLTRRPGQPGPWRFDPALEVCGATVDQK